MDCNLPCKGNLKLVPSCRLYIPIYIHLFIPGNDGSNSFITYFGNKYSFSSSKYKYSMPHSSKIKYL